jgi:hypothetical protein
MDVCLSFTKFHKEEWQAAWTISTMLNAIISFFPVKENHDSIGAIDYPIEVRKKYAQSSKKWKCDHCGPIVNLLPEMKVKSENSPTTDKENEMAANASEKEEKDDMSGMSDISSPVNRGLDSPIIDGRTSTKKDKTPKLKKLELDKKSHISNIIEGVIFEDINEDENEEDHEKNLENMRAHSQEIDLKPMIKAIDSINSVNQNKNDLNLNKLPIEEKNMHSSVDITFRRHHSDINHPGNFSEYFKKLRQAQFEQEANIKGDKSNNTHSTLFNIKQDNQETTTPIKNEDDKYFHNESIKFKNPILSVENGNQQSDNKLSSNNIIEEIYMDEYDFTDVLRSMKFHRSKSNEEIVKELFDNKENEVVLNRDDRREYFRSVLAGLINKKNNENNKSDPQHTTTPNHSEKTQIQQSQMRQMDKDLDYMVSLVEFSKNKDKLDTLYKQKDNYLKYLTRKKYKDAKRKRIEYLNIFMVILIVLTYAIYYYCRNFL